MSRRSRWKETDPMLTMAGIVLGLAASAIAGENIDYGDAVDIVKVDVAPAAEARRYGLTVTLNAPPELPKGIKIVFQLQRDGNEVADSDGNSCTFTYTLTADAARKGLRFTWTPKARLSVDKYNLVTLVPLSEQTPEVKKVIQGMAKRFPPGMEPWTKAHPDKMFQVGSEKEEKAELEEVKTFVQEQVDALIELNNEAMDEFEKVKGGEAHVKGDKLNAESLKKSLSDWMGRMAKVQLGISEAIASDPGLYDGRFRQVHGELAELGRMIGKRITKTELKKILDAHKITMTAFKLPAVKGFDGNYARPTASQHIKERCDAIKRLLDPDAKEEGAGEPEGAEGAGKKADGPQDGADSGKADSGKKEGEAASGTEEVQPEEEKPAPKAEEKPKAEKTKAGAKKTDAKKPKEQGKKKAE